MSVTLFCVLSPSLAYKLTFLSVFSFEEEGSFFCSQSAGMGFGLSCSGSFG